MPSGDAASGREALILFYNSFFGGHPDFSSFLCSSPCRFTIDRNLLDQADAVIFHLPQLNEVGTVAKRPGQLWVAWSMESRGHTPVRNNPAIMRLFDLHMTFERSADVWCPYLPKRNEWDTALSIPLPPKTEPAPAVMFQSAPSDLSGRNAYAAELMSHMRIDSFGAFLRNRTMTEKDEGNKTKNQTISRYKFCIAFENTVEIDYVTEKFFQPLLSGTLPIYLGAPNVELFAPGDRCYIDTADFADPQALAAYLTDLAGKETEYASYFEWRSKPLRPSFLSLTEKSEAEAFCRLADVVVQHRKRNGSL